MKFSSEEKLPRGCNTGRKVKIHLCKKMSCWPFMADVCHPEHITLPKIFAPHICDSCTGCDSRWVFRNVKVITCPGYTGPLEDKRDMLALFGDFDWDRDWRENPQEEKT